MPTQLDVKLVQKYSFDSKSNMNVMSAPVLGLSLQHNSTFATTTTTQLCSLGSGSLGDIALNFLLFGSKLGLLCHLLVLGLLDSLLNVTATIIKTRFRVCSHLFSCLGQRKLTVGQLLWLHHELQASLHASSE